MTIKIHRLGAEEDLTGIKKLFQSYGEWLENDHRISPETHGIASEIANLPRPYAPPDGVLITAETLEDDCVGCIALRRFDDAICEVKRLYVLPEMRGHHLGERLVAALIEEAKLLGYRTIMLDVGDYQKPAMALYAKCGFKPIEPKQHISYPGAVFMALDIPS